MFKVSDYLENPKDYLNKISIDELVKFLEKANIKYREGEALLSDDMYDYATDYLKKKDKNHPFLDKIGSDVAHDDTRKVLLPVWMGSQDKIRDDSKALDRWKNKYNSPYVISDKLDGISGLVEFTNNKEYNLYTRGNGEYGQLINNILPYINKNKWNIKDPVLVRGEIIMSKSKWNKNKDKGSNARNVTAGVLNSKRVKPEVAELLDFVAYELIEPKLPFDEGLTFAKKIGMNVVKHKVIDNKDELTTEFLSDYLMKRRENGEYEIDGIIIRDNEKHKIMKGKNPKYSFAFKSIMTHKEAEVMVDKVEWNISKDGLYKPLVHFNTVEIDGVKIKKATGYNAKFIEDNVLGPGSKIVIIRSGDVIPKIIKVLSPAASNNASMPDAPYEWNETHVDIRVTKDGVGNESVILQRQLEHFVNTLNIMNIGEGIIKKMITSGVKSLHEFISLTKKDILKLEGVKDKSADKIYNSLKEALENAKCEDIMAASNIFGKGFGSKKIKLILEANPEILKGKVMKSLNPVKGIGEKTSKPFLENLPLFYKFISNTTLSNCKERSLNVSNNVSDSEKYKTESKFKNMTIVFTGFRNKEWEKIIEEQGGKLGSSISKNTSIVVVKDPTKKSSKLDKALEIGIEIISMEDFKNKYHL
jgi:DNA ligase (NAD+)